MNVPELLRGATPIVCLAPHEAFQQEAAFQQEMEQRLTAAGSEATRPVRRIRVEIVPDPAAAQPRGARTATKQDEKHG